MMASKLEKAIEAILFAAGEAVSLKNIAHALSLDKEAAYTHICTLTDQYNFEDRGIQIIQIGESFQMCTNPDYFPYIQALCETPQKKTLTPTILETLAIIAYKQPITKGGIEEIRGVNADHAVNKLMEYNMVEEKGRMDTAGKPILFGTTDEFLRHFGFASLEALPNDLSKG